MTNYLYISGCNAYIVVTQSLPTSGNRIGPFRSQQVLAHSARHTCLLNTMLVVTSVTGRKTSITGLGSNIPIVEVELDR